MHEGENGYINMKICKDGSLHFTINNQSNFDSICGRWAEEIDVPKFAMLTAFWLLDTRYMDAENKYNTISTFYDPLWLSNRYDLNHTVARVLSIIDHVDYSADDIRALASVIAVTSSKS
jgi:hypothetical protein